MNDPEIQRSFAEYDRHTTIQNSKIGAILATLLVPPGSFTIDYFVYHNNFHDFFKVRLVCSLFTLGIALLLFTERGRRFYRPAP